MKISNEEIKERSGTRTIDEQVRTRRLKQEKELSLGKFYFRGITALLNEHSLRFKLQYFDPLISEIIKTVFRGVSTSLVALFCYVGTSKLQLD